MIESHSLSVAVTVPQLSSFAAASSVHRMSARNFYSGQLNASTFSDGSEDLRASAIVDTSRSQSASNDKVSFAIKDCV